MINLLLPLIALAHIPDIPPDAPGTFYRNQPPRLNFQMEEEATADGLSPVITMGARNLDWLEHINSFRQEKISLSSKETQRGYPIDQPNEYNPALILAQFNSLKAEMPAELRTVIFENAAFTQNPPVPLASYIEWCLKADRVYQIAARWRTMAPYLSYLEDRRKSDIRGYYFLSRLPNRAEKLRSFETQPNQAELREWLIGVCFNSGSLSACEREVNQKISSKGDLEAYYLQKEPRARTLYRSYFEIPTYAPRSEYRWEAGPNNTFRFVTPFQDPGREDVRHFLRFNIEDEWKFGDWKLEMPFVNDSSLAHIEFEPGATAHVNGLGGDTITMDANQPLTEYDAQWTIRHEFGHVLGLPDCYVEFYVSEKKTIMNYQIDVDNIMCSRRGHVKAENIEELRKAYFH